MSNTTDVETAGIDSDQAITIEIKHDDKFTDEDGVYIQVNWRRKLDFQTVTSNDG